MANRSCLSFPQRVYNVLQFCEEQGREDIISWEHGGTAFKVNDLEAFQRDLLPTWFNTKKYYTFTRSLYAYGFTCVRSGRQPGIYSHPSFNRNDPMGPSLMKRASRKKSTKNVVTQNRAISNPSIETSNKRTFNLRTGVFGNGQQKYQFPSLFNEMGCEDDSGTAKVFGLLFHTIAVQVADSVTSPPVRIPPGLELTGRFDDEGDSMGPRPYPNPTPSTSTTNPAPFHARSSSSTTTTDRQSERKPITPTDRLFIPAAPVTPIQRVSSPRNVTHALQQENQCNIIPWCHDDAFDRHNRFQDQGDLNEIPVKLPAQRYSGSSVADHRFNEHPSNYGKITGLLFH